MNVSALIKRLIRDHRSLIRIFLWAAVVSFFYVYTLLRIPVLFGNAIDLLVSEDYDRFSGILIKAGLLSVLSGIFHYLSSVLSGRFSIGISKDLRQMSFRHLQHLPLSYLDVHPVGKTLDTITADIEIVSTGMQMTVSQLVIGIATIIGSTISILMLNPTATIVILLLTPFSLLLTRFLSKSTHKFFVKQSEARRAESSYVEEILSIEKIVKGFQQEKNSITRFNELDDTYRASSENATFFSSLTNPSTRLLNNVIYSLIAFLGALICMKSGEVFTIGQFSALLTFANQFGKPFNDVSSVITELQNTFSSLNNIYTFLDEEEEAETADSIQSPLNAEGKVEISDLYFSYSPDTKLIQDFNLEVQKGQHVAIVGPTGCGKTTLINLLMRFYDSYKGTIKIDGVNSKSLRRGDLRSNFGMVLQDTWIKTATVKENLSFANPDASLEDIIAISKITKADEFIRRLPQGYGTVIGEEGTALSDGQRQLLCITRLFLTMPPIIILDEATSSVDTKTERDIFDSLERLLKGRTSFIVAHRLSTIESADVILVMKAGRIIEKGNHKSLIEKKGFYYDLYQSQYTLAQEPLSN